MIVYAGYLLSRAGDENVWLQLGWKPR